MSKLFFRKDNNFDAKVRGKEDTKYDTYRLWGKAEDFSDVAYEIYVKIPKGESIGNLVPNTNILPSQIKEIKEKRDPMLFYFDHLDRSTLTIDPTINIQIDPDLELHLKDARLEDVQDFSFLNNQKNKKEVYIAYLGLNNVAKSSVAFLEEGFRSSSKNTCLDYNTVQGLHIETSNVESLDFRSVTTYDINTDFSCDKSRKIVITSPTTKRSSFSMKDTELNFTSSETKDTSVIFNVKGALIRDSAIEFSFDSKDTISFGEGTILDINKANISLKDATVIGPNNGTLSISTNNDTISEERDFSFDGNFETTLVTSHNAESEYPIISLREKGWYQNALIYYFKSVILTRVDIAAGTLKADKDKPLSLSDSTIIESNLFEPRTGDEYKVDISKVYLNNVTLNRPNFIYKYKGERPLVDDSSIFVTGQDYSSLPYLSNCEFHIKNKEEQQIFIKGETATAIKSAIFEGKVNVEVSGVPSIDHTIFKNTQTTLSDSKGFSRCEFVEENNLSSISSDVTNGFFKNAKCYNINNLSYNCVQDFSGANGSYSEGLADISEGQKNTENLDIL